MDAKDGLIYFIHILVSSQSALVEDIAVLLTCWGRGCCDIAVCLAVDFAILEPGNTWTEDEISCSLDIAVVESYSCATYTSIDCILIAQ